MSKRQYPLSFTLITERPEFAKDVFLKERPHKGAFVGTAKLEGSFLCDNTGELFSELEIGERLNVAPEESKQALPPLTVSRENGTVIGKLPFSDAIMPNILLQRGVSVWCYAEAKLFNAGLLEIAVSIYCDKY